MPTINLTRALIAEIKCHESSDYVALDRIDPQEQNLVKMTRLLSNALKVTQSLKVVELVAPSFELVRLIAHALHWPRCRLQALVLKNISPSAFAEMNQALSHFPAAQVSMTTTGIVGTSYQQLTISLGNHPLVALKLTAVQRTQLAISGLPALTPAPTAVPLLPPAPLMPNRSPLPEDVLNSSESPVVREHSLSASSRWGHGDSLMLRDRFRSADLVAGLEADNIPERLHTTSSWNPWQNSDAYRGASRLISLSDAEDALLSLSELSVDALTPQTVRWNGMASTNRLSESSRLTMTQLAPMARFAHDDQQQAALIESLLSEAAGQASVSESDRLSAIQTTLSQVTSNPPVSAFVPIAAIGVGASNQLSMPPTAFAVHAPKFKH